MLNKYFSFFSIKSYVLCHILSFLLFVSLYHNQKKYGVYFCRTLRHIVARQFGELT